MNFPYLNESGLINVYTLAPEKSAYTLSASNMGQILICSPSTPLTITIPVGLPKNFYCAFLRTTSSAVALTPASGVGLSSAVEDDGVSTISVSFQLVELVMFGNNLFVASGFGNAGGTTATWGLIGGTLASQTDLVAALAAKQTITAKIYEATIDIGSGTPGVPVVADGNTVGAIDWTDTDTGVITGTLAGAFTNATRIFFSMGPPANPGTDGMTACAYRVDDDRMRVSFFDAAGAAADANSLGCSIRITVDLS